MAQGNLSYHKNLKYDAEILKAVHCHHLQFFLKSSKTFPEKGLQYFVFSFKPVEHAKFCVPCKCKFYDMYAVLRIRNLCLDPDPELLLRIQQKMKQHINNKHFISHFRPGNSGLCVL